MPSGLATPAPQPVKVVTVTIPAARILTLTSNPLEFVASPGPGKTLVALSSTFVWLVATTPYSGSTEVRIGLTTHLVFGFAFAEAGTILAEPSDEIVFYGGGAGGLLGPYAVTDVADSGISVKAYGGTNPAGGDGSLRVTVAYHEAPTA